MRSPKNAYETTQNGHFQIVSDSSSIVRTDAGIYPDTDVPQPVKTNQYARLYLVDI